jgi:hypothetical protein
MSQKGVKMYFLGIIQVLGINFALKIIFWINFSVLLRSGLRALITDNSGLNKQMFPRLRTYPRRTAGWLGKTPGSHLESARSEGVSYYLGRWIRARWFILDQAHYEPANDTESHDRDLTYKIPWTETLSPGLIRPVHQSINGPRWFSPRI